MTEETAEEIRNGTSAAGLVPAPHMIQLQMQITQSLVTTALECNRALLKLNPFLRHLVS